MYTLAVCVHLIFPEAQKVDVVRQNISFRSHILNKFVGSFREGELLQLAVARIV